MKKGFDYVLALVLSLPFAENFINQDPGKLISIVLLTNPMD